MQVVTILEGDVQENRWEDLQNAFDIMSKGESERPSLSFLIQDVKKRSLWKIISVWESMEVLEKMRGEGTPAGVLMFREAGVEPTLTINEVGRKL